MSEHAHHHHHRHSEHLQVPPKHANGNGANGANGGSNGELAIGTPGSVERKLWRSQSGSLLTGKLLAEALASKRGPCEKRELHDPFQGTFPALIRERR